MSISNLDIRRMRDAIYQTNFSPDPSTQIGVVIDTEGSHSVIYGGNRLPAGISRDLKILDREEKLRLIVHAEMDAIATAARYGDRLQDATLYLVAKTKDFGFWGSAPCTNCTKHVIASGIKRVVSINLPCPERWILETQAGREMLEEAGVIYEEIPHGQLTD